MTTKIVDGVTVNTFDLTIPKEEIVAYVERARAQYPNAVKRITIVLDDDGEHVHIHTELHHRPFERVRCITGYLSRLDTFNDAKQHEEQDRTINVVEGQTPPFSEQELADAELPYEPDYYTDMIWAADDLYIPGDENILTDQ